MGEIIKSFTFGRNALKRTEAESATAVIDSIRKAESGIDLVSLKRDDNGSYNVIRDLISFSGVLAREGNACKVTELGEVFKTLYANGENDAWRWLITRSLWLYIVPNGTNSNVNPVASRLGTSFSFFRTMVGLLSLMYAFPRNERFLYYEELCVIFDDDTFWSMKPEDILGRLMQIRRGRKSLTHENSSLLGDLEDKYSIPRDNLNTVVNKAFKQTGLFEYALSGARVVGISIFSGADSVLQKRIRFVLDNDPFSDRDWLKHLQIRVPDMPLEVTRRVVPAVSKILTGDDLSSVVTEFANPHAKSGLLFKVDLVQRFVASILSKRFFVATGLSGSGKTKLVQAFARWVTPNNDLVGSENPYYAVVPVGADWAGNENILGYPNGLDQKDYITKPALNVILHAIEHQEFPHFLILDEMNLSHVERYFSDFLSMIESGESINLYCDKRDEFGQPVNTRSLHPILKLPKNLFIVGTVNVDETTYMFSPKVLDRANVAEFRVCPADMEAFLKESIVPDLEGLEGQGERFGPGLVVCAGSYPADFIASEKARFDSEMTLYYSLLQEHGAEFGYRVANEASSFVRYYKMLGKGKVWNADQLHQDGGSWEVEDIANRDWVDYALDAVVIQKVLPKLHGSKIKLGQLLKKLYTACLTPANHEIRIYGGTDLKEPVKDVPANARYPLSAEKIYRMWRHLNENGFTSFPEN